MHIEEDDDEALSGSEVEDGKNKAATGVVERHYSDGAGAGGAIWRELVQVAGSSSSSTGAQAATASNVGTGDEGELLGLLKKKPEIDLHVDAPANAKKSSAG